MKSLSNNTRINRLIGQLRGIVNMIDQKRDCIEILQQISAVKKALEGFEKELIYTELSNYVQSQNIERMKKIVDKIF